MKRWFKIIAITVILLPCLYLLSYGPAVYWVRLPIISTHTALAFDSYDRRLISYLSFYSPIQRIRSDHNSLDVTLEKYQAFFHRPIVPDRGLVLGQIYLPRSYFDELSGLPKPVSIASDGSHYVEAQGVTSRLSGQTFDTGYVYYLPRSEILVACGEPLLVDLMQVIIQDGPRINSSPLLP